MEQRARDAGGLTRGLPGLSEVSERRPGPMEDEWRERHLTLAGDRARLPAAVNQLGELTSQREFTRLAVLAVFAPEGNKARGAIHVGPRESGNFAPSPATRIS